VKPGIEVRHSAVLSDDLQVTIAASVHPSASRADWRPAPPSRPLTAGEAFEYGQVTARAWAELARLSRENLIYVGMAPLAEGLRAGGATLVEIKAGAAFAVFQGRAPDEGAAS
jgi:hypothetical protein